MTRDPRDRFADMLAAIDRCMSYGEHLADANPTIAEMAYDAVLRNIVVHEYFRIDRSIIKDIGDNQLEPLAE